MRAEFLRGSDDADAKDFFPEAVGHHTCRERVVLVQQPLGEVHAVRDFIGRGEAFRGEGLDKTGADFGPVAEVRAAQVHVGLTAVGGVDLAHDGHGGGGFECGELAFQLGDLLLLLLGLRAVFGVVVEQLGHGHPVTLVLRGGNDGSDVLW